MGQGRNRSGRYALRAILGIPLLIILLPFLLVGLPLYGLYRWVKGTILTRQFRRTWVPRGKVAIFVYSDSPNWKEYIETAILPRVAARVVTLNWSRRAEWKTNPSLEVRVFQHWSGRRAFNPMVIVVPRRGGVRTIRLWNAFQEYKHGKLEPLREQEQLLFESISAAAIAGA